MPRTTTTELRPHAPAPEPIAPKLDQISPFDRVLIVSLPRSGTSTYRTLFANLFGLQPVLAACETDPALWPDPPKWKPYERDGTIAALRPGQVACIHGEPSAFWLEQLADSPRTLVVHAYRDIRDAALSATRYIRHRPAHLCARTLGPLAFEDALACVITGCRIPYDDQPAHIQARNPDRLPLEFGGYDELGACSAAWAAMPGVAQLRYESVFHGSSGPDHLAGALEAVGIRLDLQAASTAVEHVGFQRLTGRQPGERKPGDHLDRGLPGAWAQEPLSLAIRILAQRVLGPWLERFAYPPDTLEPRSGTGDNDPSSTNPVSR